MEPETYDHTGGFAYIRWRYKVPARRGQRVRYSGSAGPPITGTITHYDGPHIMVRADPGQGYRPSYRLILHPTWKVEYL